MFLPKSKLQITHNSFFYIYVVTIFFTTIPQLTAQPKANVGFDKSYNAIENLIISWQLKSAMVKIEEIENSKIYSEIEKAKIKFLKAQVYMGLDYNYKGQKMCTEVSSIFKSYYGEKSEWYRRVKCYESFSGFLGGGYYKKDSLSYYLPRYIDAYPDSIRQILIVKLRQLGTHSKVKSAKSEITQSEMHPKIIDYNNLYFTIEFCIHLADGYKRKGDFDQSFYWLQKALKILSDNKVKDTHLNVVVYRNLISYYNSKGNTLKSKHYAELQLSSAKNAAYDRLTDPWIANAYANLATAQKDLKEYEQALDTFSKMESQLIRFRKSQYADLPKGFAGHLAQHEIAKLHYEMKDYDKSIERTLEVLDILNIIWPIDSPDLQEGRRDKAKQYTAYYLSTLASVLIAKENPEEAIRLLEPAVKVLEKERLMQSRYTLKTLNVLAKAYYSKGDYSYAIEITNKAIQLNKSDKGYKQYADFFESMIIKTKSFVDLNDSKGIEDISREITSVLLNIIYEFDDFKSKENFLIFSKEWFDLAFGYYVEYDNTIDRNSHLFRLIEYQRGVSIYSKVLQNRDYIKLNSVEDTYNEEIFNLEKKLYESRLGAAVNVELKKKIIALKNQKSESEILNFQKKQVRFTPLSIEKLQSQLLNNETNISYFKANKIYYALTLNSERSELYPLGPIDGLDSLIGEFKENIYNYYLSCIQNRVDLQKEFEEFKVNAQKLATLLIEPLDLSDDVTLLSISPFGKMNYIPFDALLLNDSLEQNVYLCSQYAINYQPSISLLKDLSESNNDQVYLYAPEFEIQKDTFCVSETYRNEYLGPLKFNQEEVNNINEVIGGQIINSNKQDFLSKYNNAKLIHLATHGKVDLVNDNFSFLAFRNDDQDSSTEKLYLQELLFNNFNAECVVLSACESGLGNNYISEGLKSMASSFMVAGAQSVISTQWTVNDRSTSMIMQSFYKNLKAGERKDVALQKAKLNYLSKVDPEYQHPFYWAGFTAIGNMDSMSFDISINWYLYGFMSIFGLLLISWLKFRVRP